MEYTNQNENKAYQMSASSEDNRWWYDLVDSEGKVVVGVGGLPNQAIQDAEENLKERVEYIALSNLEKLQHAIDNDIIRSSQKNDLLKIAIKVLLEMNRVK